MRIARQQEHDFDEPILGADACVDRRFRRYVHRWCPTARTVDITCHELFLRAAKAVSSISVSRGTLGGVPCVEGTRIPVYMILDALDYYGTVRAVRKSYPGLTIAQIRDALRFAKSVLEVPVDDQAAPSPR